MSTLSVDTITGQTIAGNVKMPAGHVLQVVQGTSTNYLQVGSNNAYVDTGLTATITPKYNTSKVLILHSAPTVYSDNQDAILRLMRGSTNIHQLNVYTSSSSYNASTFAFQFLDSPSTTSATTYKTQAYKNQGNFFYSYTNEVASTSTLTLLEIAQ